MTTSPSTRPVGADAGTLFGTVHTRSYRCIWMLEELGLPYDNVPVAMEGGFLSDPNFLETNPNGRVPAYTDDIGTFWEGHAINIYLAKRYGGPLQPQSLLEDVRTVQWSIWSLTEIERPLFIIAVNTKMFVDERSEHEIALAKKKLKRPLAALAGSLDKTEYLLGGRFTVADLNVASVLAMAEMADMDLREYSETVERYYRRCTDRPAAPDFKSIISPQSRPERWEELLI